MSEPPAATYATLDVNNLHPVLDFDTTTAELVYFTGLIPSHFTAAAGITVILTWSCAATSGNVGWLIACERISDGGTDIDADSFQADQTVTAETVDGTSGIPDVSSVAITNANADGIAAGDFLRIRVTRNTAVDTAAGDAHLIGIEIRET